MENITHVTRQGSSEFGLANTNKLIKQYEYATGLKTGSTGLAKYCVSATAEKNDMELIAVIMAAPDYKVRFNDAITLLNYGFGKCKIYEDANQDTLPRLAVTGGTSAQTGLQYEDRFRYLDTKGQDIGAITKEIQLPDSAAAPIKEGDIAGKAVYKLSDTQIGSVNILFQNTIRKAHFKDYFLKVLDIFLI